MALPASGNPQATRTAFALKGVDHMYKVKWNKCVEIKPPQSHRHKILAELSPPSGRASALTQLGGNAHCTVILNLFQDFSRLES